MRIAMVGTGYVGLVSGVCFSDFGHDVICVDTNPAKIETLRSGVSPIYEPGLEALIAKNVAAGRLSFSTDLVDAIEDAEAVFIAVGTPTRRGDGHADLSYVYAAAQSIADALKTSAVVVIKSTVPVGTNKAVSKIMRERRPDLDIDVASNPEFLREGAAIEDFMRPDRVIVGLEGNRARAVMSALYRPLSLRETPVVFMSPASAELTKYAANAFLATKITFINEIANLCESTGANVKDIAKGVGLDGRIGSKFLHAGPGYGGSCFPKDTLALARMGQMHNAPQHIIETVIEVNEARKRQMVDKIVAALDDRIAGRRITVFGVTFKPETDDMRAAPSLTIIPSLIGGGATVTACDPQGRKEGEALLPNLIWAADPYEAAANADAVIILTEWNMFRALDLARLKATMAGDVIVDLRNIYRSETVTMAGLRHFGVGMPDASEQEAAT